jgi:hypothetical protein
MMRTDEEGMEIVASVTLGEALLAILGDSEKETRKQAIRQSEPITQPIRVLHHRGHIGDPGR